MNGHCLDHTYAAYKLIALANTSDRAFEEVCASTFNGKIGIPEPYLCLWSDKRRIQYRGYAGLTPGCQDLFELLERRIVLGEKRRIYLPRFTALEALVLASITQALSTIWSRPAVGSVLTSLCMFGCILCDIPEAVVYAITMIMLYGLYVNICIDYRLFTWNASSIVANYAPNSVVNEIIHAKYYYEIDSVRPDLQTLGPFTPYIQHSVLLDIAT